MKFKNIRRDDNCAMAETKLAGEFIERTIDHYDDIPEDMRVIVIVASGDGKGKIGCAFEGYDSDERLALDLQMLSQAVDLGPAPTVELQHRLDSTVDAHVEATRLHNAERDRWCTDLDGARAALRREQDARAELRVALDRETAERKRLERQRDAARAAARAYAARVDDLGLAADDDDPKVMATAGPIGMAQADLYAALGILDEEIARRCAQQAALLVGDMEAAVTVVARTAAGLVMLEVTDPAVIAALQDGTKPVSLGYVLGEPAIPAFRFFAAHVRDCPAGARVALVGTEERARGLAELLMADPSDAPGYSWSVAGSVSFDSWCVVDAAPKTTCCPQAALGTHDVGCRGGGKVH